MNHCESSVVEDADQEPQGVVETAGLGDLIPVILKTRMPSTGLDAKARKRAYNAKWQREHMAHVLAYQKRRRQAQRAAK